MSAPLHYTPSDSIERPGTWTLESGTERSADYAPEFASNGDPSNPVWILENQIRLVGDFGTAREIAMVALFAHTFQEGTVVRVQANATNVWTAPSLSVNIPIKEWYRDGFSCAALVDLRTAYPSAGARTFRYWSIDNMTDANDVTVAIGEVVLASDWLPLEPFDIQHNYVFAVEHLASRQSTKRGVQMVYDVESRHRAIQAACRTNLSGFDNILDWIDEQHGIVNPMVIDLDIESSSRRLAEPFYVRFQDAVLPAASTMHGEVYDIALNFDELGSGPPVVA
jgi:hypothetical protein